MESDLLKARALCRRYLDATTSDAEERELRELLASLPRKAMDRELRSVAAMTGGFEALARETLPRRTARNTAPEETAEKAAQEKKAAAGAPTPVADTSADTSVGIPVGTARRLAASARQPHRRWNLLLGTGAGIAAALLVGLFFLTRGTVYGYIDGRPVTDPAEAMCATAYFQPLEELSRSFDIADRLLEAAGKGNTAKQQ